MRKVLLTLILGLIGATSLCAQQFQVSLEYQMLNARQWNKATQAYNFARPFLTEKQPLMGAGVQIGLAYLLHPENTVSFGPSVKASLHRSSSENPNFNIDINAVLLDLGMKIQYRPEMGQKRLAIGFTPSIAVVMLTRKLNGEVVVIGPTEEDRALRTFGAGLTLNAQAAYAFPLGDKASISPVVGFNYDPFVWAFRSEVVFNEASVGDLKSNTQIWRFQAGLLVSFGK